MNIKLNSIVNSCYPQPENIEITFNLDRIDTFELIEILLCKLKEGSDRIEVRMAFDGEI